MSRRSKFEVSALKLSCAASMAVVNLCPTNVWSERYKYTKQAIKTGELFPGNRRLRSYGWSRHKELCDWVGVKLPKKRNPTLLDFRKGYEKCR